MEYELIDITFEPEELPLQNQMVCDDSEVPFGPIEYDENGIPKGKSKEEIKKREKMLLMSALGKVKLIVGLQRSTQELVQYSITVPESKEKSPSKNDELIG